jgi:hypothetical protein
MKIRQDKNRKKLDARFHGVFTRAFQAGLQTSPPAKTARRKLAEG